MKKITITWMTWKPRRKGDTIQPMLRAVMSLIILSFQHHPLLEVVLILPLTYQKMISIHQWTVIGQLAKVSQVYLSQLELENPKNSWESKSNSYQFSNIFYFSYPDIVPGVVHQMKNDGQDDDSIVDVMN